MKIALQTWGSDGDVRPFIALAAGLKAAGHEVRLYATSVDNTDYSGLAQRLGLDIRMVPQCYAGSLQALGQKFVRTRNDLVHLHLLLQEGYIPVMREMGEASREAAEWCDVGVHSFICWTTRAELDHIGKPSVPVYFWSGFLPTTTASPEPLPTWPGLPRVIWSVVEYAMNRILLPYVQQYSESRGLPKPTDLIRQVMTAPKLNLLASSPSLWPSAADWGPRFLTCGEFRMPGEAEPWTPEPALQAFLDDGPPPLFLSLGSPEQIDPSGVQSLLSRAALFTGQRALIQLKSQRLTTGYRDGSRYYMARAPHPEVLARCSAAVLHGGAGTTHVVARSGRPSVTVPFMSEQMSWGRRLHKLGVAAKPLHYLTAEAGTLAARLMEAKDSTEMRRKAEALAARMATEDGVATAVAAIEQRFP